MYCVFRLRGLVHVGKVETSVNDDVTDRFHVDENDCPTFLLYAVLSADYCSNLNV